MSIDLTGKVIVITGASSGIGAATAEACASAGMRLVLHGRDEGRLEAVAEQVRQRGGQVRVELGDVTEPGINARLLDTAEREFGGFDVVFANAGYGYKKPMHEMPEEALRRMFDVNFFAATALLREAACRLIAARRQGHLLMCSSAVAKFTMINFAAYSASKAAQNHVCRAMRMELRRYGIPVSSVHPITTRTGFFQRSGEFLGRPMNPERAYEQVPRWLLQEPKQVAEAIVRCLRRPVPEVWTTIWPRLAAAFMIMFPGFMDLIGTRVRTRHD